MSKLRLLILFWVSFYPALRSDTATGLNLPSTNQVLASVKPSSFNDDWKRYVGPVYERKQIPLNLLATLDSKLFQVNPVDHYEGKTVLSALNGGGGDAHLAYVVQIDQSGHLYNATVLRTTKFDDTWTIVPGYDNEFRLALTNLLPDLSSDEIDDIIQWHTGNPVMYQWWYSNGFADLFQDEYRFVKGYFIQSIWHVGGGVLSEGLKVTDVSGGDIVTWHNPYSLGGEMEMKVDYGRTGVEPSLILTRRNTTHDTDETVTTIPIQKIKAFKEAVNKFYEWKAMVMKHPQDRFTKTISSDLGLDFTTSGYNLLDCTLLFRDAPAVNLYPYETNQILPLIDLAPYVEDGLQSVHQRELEDDKIAKDKEQHEKEDAAKQQDDINNRYK